MSISVMPLEIDEVSHLSELSLPITSNIKTLSIKFENDQGISNPIKQNLKRHNYDNKYSWLISSYKKDKQNLLHKNERDKQTLLDKNIKPKGSIFLTLQQVLEIEKNNAIKRSCITKENVFYKDDDKDYEDDDKDYRNDDKDYDDYKDYEDYVYEKDYEDYEEDYEKYFKDY